MILSVVSAILYGVLAIVGGIIGYRKAGSNISLFSGVISGFLLIISGLVVLQGKTWGLTLGAAITCVLVIVFAFRLVKTRKIMPAGLMTVLGLLVLLLMLNQLLMS